MKFLTDPMLRAGYKIHDHFEATERLKKWESYFELPPGTTQPPAPAGKPDDLSVDDFVLTKTEALILELLSHSHADLVKKTKPVTDAFQIHMITPRIVHLIYQAITEAGELDGMVSARHRAMATSGQFSTNAVARCYVVAHAKLKAGAVHSPKSAFARAVKLYGESLAAKQPVRIRSFTVTTKSVATPAGHKKSPAQKAEDCGFPDR